MDNALGKKLVQDELFDLTLYRELRKKVRGEDAKELLDELIPIEEKHFSFWKEFFGISDVRLSGFKKFKLGFLVLFCRVFGNAGFSLILEAIEINGVKKYLQVWEIYKQQPIGDAVENILNDELRHEDVIVSDKISRKIHPERIRDIFLGLNDGLVEILGAISGFFLAFQTIPLVLAASLTVAIAGAFSMAAGAFVAMGSEQEAEEIERGKKRFLEGREEVSAAPHPLSSAFLVGFSYLLGAAIPIAPVFFGSSSVLLSLLVSAVAVIVVSYILAFLSGMDVKRRIIKNLIIITLAVGVTSLIGVLARTYLGIDV